jgi:hypothetical protein
LVPGDIIYVSNGVTATGTDPRQSYDCTVCITEHGGTAAAPTALVGYPGNTTVLGDAKGRNSTFRVPNLQVTADYWTFSNLFIQGPTAIDPEGHPGTTGWRVVGNDITCPSGGKGGADGCYTTSRQNFTKFLGNVVHDVAKNTNPGKQYHAVYWSTDSNHIEVGWNVIGPSNGCRGIQFHSSPDGPRSGFNQFDLHVHDNFIYDIRCDGINFATVDPARGPVQIYNNIIVHAGAGPDPPDGASNYACVYVPGKTNFGPAPGLTAFVEIYNNTLYDCGARRTSDSGGIAVGQDAAIMVRLRNNILDSMPGESYIEPSSLMGDVSGTNNLFFGIGRGPSFLRGNVNADPLFVKPGSRNFHLQSGSPAIDAGADTRLATDFDGNPRPEAAAFDIGAYEFTPR